MKKVAISLIALAAVSTVAFANENRSYELRDSQTYFGKYATHEKVPNADINANAFALALMDDQDGLGLSAFERMKKLSEENDEGRH